PGGELAVIPELIQGHPSPHGFDLCGTAFGTVALDAVITGADAKPGDALIGLPASGPHSNGYTLARHALLDDGGGRDGLPALDMHATPPELGGASVLDALLEPTVIYVRAVLDLIRSDVPVNGLAHLTGGGLLNLLRLGSDRLGWQIDTPLPVTPIFELIARHGDVSAAEMWEVFNMGCGFVCVVPADRAEDAVQLLAAYHPGAAVIGTVTDAGGTVSVPSLGLAGDKSGLRAG
ncbi:MAG: purM, partial [Solirubrobacterales bacterium]|nr:purM [Solirubrobacterales bacterium]